MATPTAQELQTQNPNMYKPYQALPPTPQYSIPGTNDFTTNPQQEVKNSQPASIPGVGVVSNPGAYSKPATPVPLANIAPLTPVQPLQPSTAPVQPSTAPIVGSPSNQVPSTDLTKKYQETFSNIQASGKSAPTSVGAGNAGVQENIPSAPQSYQPTQQFLQVGDPIMQSFIQNSLQQKQEITDAGHTAQYLKANFSNQLTNLNTREMNLNNIMLGTVDDVRNEISKAGGFATESQVQGLVASRNKDLIRQYNSLELQKTNMQSQMTMQVQLADMDRQYAQDRYNNTLGSYQLYKGIYDNTTSQVDKLIQNVGYSGLAKAYDNNPYALSQVEQHLNMPQGTLSDPQKLSALETYRQKTLNLTNARFSAIYGYPASGASVGVTSPPTGNTPNFPGGGEHPTENPAVPYAQYGLLSHTDFDPKNATDKNANNYLTNYLKTGVLPTKAGDIGITVRGVGAGTQFNDAKTRAENMYFQATGQNLPTPEIIKNNIALINANNTLANKLDTQELTVGANVDLSIENMNKNGLNSSKFAPLNGLIDYVKNLFNDPAVGQLLSQNETIRNELGSLMSVKNASGTTVYDKLSTAGIISSTDTPDNMRQKISTLITEAGNFKSALTKVNGELYKQTDPLEQQTNNPNRQNTLNSPTADDVLMTYKDGSKHYVPKNKVNELKQHGWK